MNQAISWPISGERANVTIKWNIGRMHGDRDPNEQPVAADDAKQVRWFSLGELPPLAFDHDQIIQMAYELENRPFF